MFAKNRGNETAVYINAFDVIWHATESVELVLPPSSLHVNVSQSQHFTTVSSKINRLRCSNSADSYGGLQHYFKLVDNLLHIAIADGKQVQHVSSKVSTICRPTCTNILLPLVYMMFVHLQMRL
jgi:hypothetical protein